MGNGDITGIQGNIVEIGWDIQPRIWYGIIWLWYCKSWEKDTGDISRLIFVLSMKFQPLLGNPGLLHWTNPCDNIHRGDGRLFFKQSYAQFLHVLEFNVPKIGWKGKPTGNFTAFAGISHGFLKLFPSTNLLKCQRSMPLRTILGSKKSGSHSSPKDALTNVP